ncbi:NADP-dependent oxidoreductase [Arcicella sp. LKC2W]|uniref:NADP-dependent oxidoreductase n=1 Tax=Arcicella sp. LKC2W TaxID=2984198 RepID=UPI002B1F773B|nr:NADP-dependent oxidoreductase [Arcicella sp. LKC2W]MEA5461001.1 NADP-dependent oxidoreductase [Arcicella sp. LKC2W]
MKAIVLKEFGGIENLLLSEIPKPSIQPKEVLIEVKAISINPVDVRTRSGSAMAQHLKQYLPLILGWDISGIVSEVGTEVTDFKLGDEVFGLVNFLGHGKAYAEYVAVPANQLAIKPSNINYEEAAAATLAALTAWQFLKENAKIKQGDRVLIQAASGGVGHYAVQMAKYLGAYVIGVSSSKNRAFVLAMGADEHIAYDESPFEDIKQDVDIVIDAFAHDNLYKSLKVIKKGGKIISLLPMISEDFLQKAKDKEVEVLYSLVTSSGINMKEIAELLAKGLLISKVSKTYPFDQMGIAHLEMETGKTIGKIVVKI